MRNVGGLSSVTLERYFIVGTGGTGLIEKTLNQLKGRKGTGVLEGRLEVVPDNVRRDVRVEVLGALRKEERRAAGILVPDEDGTFSAELFPGAYDLVVHGVAGMESSPLGVVVVPGQVSRVTLAVPQPASLKYEVSETGVGPVPCKIVLQAGFDAPRDASIVHTVWTASGEGVEKVRPGAYTVTACRGYEYELVRKNLELTAGQEGLFTAELLRSVDTHGFMSGDFHLHSEFSVDSRLTAEHRVRCLVAEGVEMPVFTDHDFCSDYSGEVSRMGLDRYIVPVTGDEVSPAFGHFNAWPMTKPAGAPDYFGVRFVEYDDKGVATERHEMPAMWDIARSEFGAGIIQVNHPRSSDQGWFEYVGYDRNLGVASVKKERWSPDFDALEVFNSGSWPEDYGKCLPDWYSLLNQGLAYTATGNSDSHTPEDTAGYPRNLFAMPTDSPEGADPADMVNSIRGHASVVSGGPFIRFETGDGWPVGALVSAPGGPVSFHVRVEAPSWMELDTVQIIANGEVVRELVPSTTGVVRVDEAVLVTPVRDTWYVVFAMDQDGTLGPVAPGQKIFALTNPIWVDRDGNGVFDPPGLP